ncbi:MAG: glycerophosphoryl diester phosphodiesterase membrane domain-containing protein [Symbiobacteriia bacterium]
MAANNWEWKPRTVGDWLDGIFQVYRGSFKSLFGVAAALLLPIAVAQGILLRETTTAIWSGFFAGLQGHATPELFSPKPADILGAPLASIVSMIVGFYLLAAGIWLVNQYLHSQPDGIRAALRRSGAPFLRLFGLLILEGLVLTLGAAAVIALFLGIGYAVHIEWLFVIGLVPALLGVTYLGVRWGMAIQVVVIENLDVLPSLRRSFKLTAGSFWSIFGRLLLYGLISGAISTALSMVVTIVAGVAGFTGSVVAIVASQGVGAVVNAAVVPLGWIATTLIYYDLRIRKEGYDLEQRAERLEQEVTAP